MDGIKKWVAPVAAMTVITVLTVVALLLGGVDKAYAANASCSQYVEQNVPPPGTPPYCQDLPFTGYLLIPVVGVGLALLAIGLVGRGRTR